MHIGIFGFDFSESTWKVTGGITMRMDYNAHIFQAIVNTKNAIKLLRVGPYFKDESKKSIFVKTKS